MNASWEAAARNGDAESLAAQLSSGTDVDALDRYGQTALMLACMKGSLGAVRVLVESGARLDVTAKFGLSAVMLAALNGHSEIARFLKSAGANLALRGTGAPGFAGRTAADLAVDRGLVALAADLSP